MTADNPSSPVGGPLTNEFYVQFSQENDKETYSILYRAGIKILNDGNFKYTRPVNDVEIQETLTALRDGVITKDEMKELMQGLASGKMTRLKIASLLRSKRKAASEQAG